MMPASIAGIDGASLRMGSGPLGGDGTGDSVRSMALQLLDPSLKIGEALLHPIHVLAWISTERNSPDMMFT